MGRSPPQPHKLETKFYLGIFARTNGEGSLIPYSELFIRRLRVVSGSVRRKNISIGPRYSGKGLIILEAQNEVQANLCSLRMMSD